MAIAKSKSAVTLGAMIDQAYQLREQRRQLAAEDKLIKADLDDLELKIIAKLDAEGTDRGASKTASVSIIESEEPQVVDWDAFCAFAKRTGNMHLFQRRVSAPAWRELRGLKKSEVPGLEVFKKRSLNLRVVSK